MVNNVLTLQYTFVLLFSLFVLLSGTHAYFGPKGLTCANSTFKHKFNPTTPRLLKLINSFFYGLLFGCSTLVIAGINVSIAVMVRARGVRAGSGVPKQTLITLGAITWTFTISFSLAIVNAVWDRIDAISQPPCWEVIVLCMLGVNVLANPIIYVLVNKRFRNFMVNRVRRVFAGKAPNNLVISTVVKSSASLSTGILIKQNARVSLEQGS